MEDKFTIEISDHPKIKKIIRDIREQYNNFNNLYVKLEERLVQEIQARQDKLDEALKDTMGSIQAHSIGVQNVYAQFLSLKRSLNRENKVTKNSKTKKKSAPKNPKIDSVLLKPIEDLNLSRRIERNLEFENIHLIGDLIKWSEYDLLKTPNLGKMSLQYIKDKLRKYKLRLEPNK
ncbi:MAG TPA: DNA-directed RNA polymerase subunit alpha C-terminal domain-containing protein [Puia sp.]|jgi:DNA-directed RNA polymerase alpha subunit|nr:DNA-directed RNA polymerase subunit alpha C-terminal domain-containing protein [Puia sp.]